MKVSLFVTCLVDLFKTDVGKATAELLEHLGCKVDFPESQICCGQPSYNSGYVEETKNAMKHMIKTFKHSEYVVAPSGSCAFMFKEYPHIFKDDPIWEPKARELADKTYELTQFIVEVLGVEDVGAKLEGKATYHTSCHMTRLLGVKEAPIKLLRNVEGREFTALPAEQLGNWEEWRSLGEEIRQHVLNHLDYYLYELSENVAKRGGHVFFAQTAEEASQYVKEVVQKKKAKKVVKSKSMVTEEIHLNQYLEEAGSEVIETDLGEYILQVDEDQPSHIVAPALHKNKTQIRDVLKEKLHYSNTEKPEEITAFVRKHLRNEFLTAGVGITGCNFAIAETGSITLVTNEGNADLVTSLPNTR